MKALAAFLSTGHHLRQPCRSKGAVLNGRSHKKASSSLEADERPYKQPRNGLLQPREGSDSLAAFTSGEAAEGPDADWSKQEPAADLAQGEACSEQGSVLPIRVTAVRYRHIRCSMQQCTYTSVKASSPKGS